MWAPLLQCQWPFQKFSPIHKVDRLVCPEENKNKNMNKMMMIIIITIIIKITVFLWLCDGRFSLLNDPKNLNLSFLKRSRRARSVLKDGPRSLALFWN